MAVCQRACVLARRQLHACAVTPSSRPAEAILDITRSLLFFFPLILALAYISWNMMWLAWEMGEVLVRSNWFPPTGPIRTVVVLGLSLFALQGVAQFVRDLYRLMGDKKL